MPDTFFSCDLLSSEFSDTDWTQLELNDYTLENIIKSENNLYDYLKSQLGIS